MTELDNKILALIMIGGQSSRMGGGIKSFIKFLIPFKGIRKNIRTRIQNRNTSIVPVICKDDREMLIAFYKEDVKQLSVLLERNLNYWIE